ncbi:LOW QUALITY PROTEIN: N-acetyllactosaminide beta-1,3-N-acetylglucosaminyltransferase 3-like [Gymnodraco acuticeps]|uniref:Hexosyltransferase n=1 Tax=Gymnodraco acuticeps TaxID=8218 RepID=A0A6P8UU38_GYMAC|nr:LOW QUALITY PROTEIN: N-acetyllactosaminide beta-1,3-N-acetylglucosaminyltransferase 3-like [Gymnodraco acuticeps]
MDPAETERFKQALSTQGARVGQHEQALQGIMESLHNLTAGVTQLSGRLDQSFTQLNALTASAPAPPPPAPDIPVIHPVNHSSPPLLHNGVWIRRVFVSGTTDTGFEKERFNTILEMEQREYNDIIQWDFHDSFFNLTLKQILFLEWMERNSPNAHFLLNGDDDVFAHTNNMVEYLQGLKDNDGSKHLFAGHLIYNVGPIRASSSKYYIPVQVQESNSYPSYCGGGGFLLSGYTAMVIYKMFRSITILPIDDVYMGMCLAKAGLSPASHMGFRTLGLRLPSASRVQSVDLYDPCYYRDLLLIHRFLSARMYFMWHKLSDLNLKCGP